MGEARGHGQLAEAVALRSVDLAKRGRACLEITDALLWVARLRAAGGDIASARDLLAQAKRTSLSCPDPSILDDILVRTDRRLSTHGGVARCAASPNATLTPKEEDVLRLLASDLSLPEIARELFVSYNTIKTQTQSIYRKLLVSSRSEAVARSRERDIV